MDVCPRSLFCLVESDLNSFGPVGPVGEAYKSSLLNSLTKKLVTEKKPTARKVAIDKFLQMNNCCRNFELRVESSWDEELLGTFKKVLYDFFNPGGWPLIEDYELLTHARPGPGAAVHASGGSFYEKFFSSRVSTTRSYLVALYKRYTKYDTDYVAARKGTERVFGYTLVDSSRLTTVPKTNETDRVICIEPNLNMFFQLGLGGLLESRLRSFFGIDLAFQPDRNRELARQGSLSGDFSTIDLSSASDSISVKMLEMFLPKEVLDWLRILRSPFTTLPSGDKVELHMISSMGNGTTFPLQTILFAAVVKAVMIEVDGNSAGIRNPRGNPKDTRAVFGPNGLSSKSRVGNWGVFGDDIIVGTKYSRRVLYLLKLLGFTPNPDKTFIEGPFRESCGSDWYSGHQVRGVYLKDLESPQARFIAINTLNRWSANSGIPLPNTISYLFRSIEPNMLRLVPFDEGDDAGVKVPSSLLGIAQRTRGVSYEAYLVVPSSFATRVGPMRRRSITYNSLGLYVSFLRGEIRAGKILGRRMGPNVYRLCRCFTPQWDRAPVCAEAEIVTQGLTTLRERFSRARAEWRRWSIAVENNLIVVLT